MYLKGLRPLEISIYLALITEVVNALVSPIDPISNDVIKVNQRIPVPTTKNFIRPLQEYKNKSHSLYKNESHSFSIYFQDDEPLIDSSRRQLWEYDNESDPVNDPFNINFHGYQNASVTIEQWMVDLLKGIYETRLSQGAPNPLCFNEILMESAHYHVIDIVDQELMLSHIGSDGSCSGERILRSGYDYITYGATITKTGCVDVECAIVNRPLFFTGNPRFNQFGIAREENAPKDPRWYWIFGEADEESCMGMTATTLEWPAGTPTLPPEPPTPEPLPLDPNDGSDLVNDRMMGLLSLMNAERQHMGVHNLCFNKKLILAAQLHNQDMVDNNFMSHVGTNDTSPAIRAAAFGYDNVKFISENIAGPDMPSVRAAMYYWMSSDGHHAENILDENAYHVGMAYDEGKRLFTAVFGGYWDDSETCISSITCENSESYMTSDPLWDTYACSLCMRRRYVNQFGVMGCGFGKEWYLQPHVTLEMYEMRRF